MKFLKTLLLPLSLVFGAIVFVRNLFYDKKILKQKQFDFPVINVGNLTTGGTGKTPHVEYLLRLLRKEYSVATLSRGYKRNTKGFLVAGLNDNAESIGDEPMQYHSKFSDITVAVGEDRVMSIDSLQKRNPSPDIILLDDAYQHRAVKPGLNICLLSYERIFTDDYLLPAGTLRETKSSLKRADIIIVTKSPEILVPIERKRVSEQITLLPHQQLYFSFYRYGEFNKLYGPAMAMLFGAKYYIEKRFTLLLITGIANPDGMIDYVRRQTDKFIHLRFADHHAYSLSDLEKIKTTFNEIPGSNKIILTTEKDAMRLLHPSLKETVKQLPIFYLPIEVAIHNEQEKFNQYILQYVRENTTNRNVHHTSNPVRS